MLESMCSGKAGVGTWLAGTNPNREEQEMSGYKAVFVGIGAFLAALSASVPASADGKLTITSFGGSYQEAQRKAWYEPFAKEFSSLIATSTSFSAPSFEELE